jgi:hypothetical protein
MHALSVWEVIWRVVVEMDPLLSETPLSRVLMVLSQRMAKGFSSGLVTLDTHMQAPKKKRKKMNILKCVYVNFAPLCV